MNRKFLIVLFAIALKTTLHAGNIVTLNGTFDDKDKGHRYEVPVVIDEGTVVTISSDTLVSNVRVIIKDVSGTIISDNVVTLLPSENVICVPEEYQNDKYSIELYYDDNCFYGYFTNFQ